MEKITFDEICDILKTQDKVEVILTRMDFNDEFEFNYGFGWQDLTEENKQLALKVLQEFDVSVYPYEGDDQPYVEIDENGNGVEDFYDDNDKLVSVIISRK